jgi:hypothetical protein
MIIANVINLPSRIDRKEHIEGEAWEQGFVIKFWDGVVHSQIVFMGVSQAHKQIVRDAKNRKLKETLIMEDDCKFLGPGAFRYFVEHKPLDYDLYLGGVFFGHIKDGIVKDFCGMTCYFISERFYDTFLSTNEMDNLDRSLRDKGKYVVCDPFVCTQIGGYSDNKKVYRENYDEYLQGRRLFGIVNQ